MPPKICVALTLSLLVVIVNTETRDCETPSCATPSLLATSSTCTLLQKRANLKRNHSVEEERKSYVIDPTLPSDEQKTPTAQVISKPPSITPRKNADPAAAQVISETPPITHMKNDDPDEILNEPETAPKWYITFIVGLGAAVLIMIALILTLCVFQLLWRLQQIYLARVTSAAKAPSGSNAAKTQDNERSRKLSRQDVMESINGCRDRLNILFQIGQADNPQIEARTLVSRGVKANKLQLSDGCECEIANALVSLAKVAIGMCSKRDPGMTARQRLRCVFREVIDMVKVTNAFNPMERHYHRIPTNVETRVTDKYSEGAKKERSNVQAKARSALGAYFTSEKWVDHAGICILAVYSQLCGIVYAIYLKRRFPQMYEFMGPWVLVSRGEAMAIVILTVLMVLLLNRSLMTSLRPYMQWSAVAANFVDKHALMHQWCGIMLPICAALHILGHFKGSIPAIINETDNTKVNEAFTYGTKVKFNFNSWGGALRSYPAVTGFILVAVLVTFWILSNERVRRSKFEVFHYAHLFLIPAWCLGLWAHGARQWLGCGVPLGLLAVVPAVSLAGISRLWDIWRGKNPHIRILNAVIKKQSVLLEINVANSGFVYEAGMYCMIKVPQISDFEWHPFTIASPGGDPKLQIIFATAGDWTTEFKQLLETAQRKRTAYPSIELRGGYGAPAQGMKDSKHIVLVGAGVGCTPFLSFLGSICRAAQLGDESEFDHVESAVFYWVSREPQDFTWVNYYNSIIEATPKLKDRVAVRLCLSKSLDTMTSADSSAAEAALFWNGVQFALYEEHGAGLLSKELGAPTQFGRPNWHKELGDHGQLLLDKRRQGEAETCQEPLEVHVFVCGPKALEEALEKPCDELDDDDIEFKLFAEQF